MIGAVLLVALALAGCGDRSPRPTTIAFLRAAASPSAFDDQTAFLDELERAGYRPGDNLRLLGANPDEVHTDHEDARKAAARWLRNGTDLIVALSTTGTMAAADAGGDVPILFLANDPKAARLVRDERRPEDRITGVSFRVPGDRTLDVARRALGELGRVGLLYPDTDPAAIPARDELMAGGSALGIVVITSSFSSEAELEEAIGRLTAHNVDAIVLGNSPTTVRAFDAIATVLAGRDVPVVANTFFEFALVVLEPDGESIYRQLGRQAVRLLDGTPPGDVPVEDPALFRLTLNRNVSDRLGITLPADRVEEADSLIP